MTRIHRVLMLLVLVGVTCTPSMAWAQFETPNRQFHDKTLFRLEGRHLEATCESCHLEGVFKGTPTTCKDCHWVRRQDDRFKLVRPRASRSEFSLPSGTVGDFVGSHALAWCYSVALGLASRGFVAL